MIIYHKCVCGAEGASAPFGKRVMERNRREINIDEHGWNGKKRREGSRQHIGEGWIEKDGEAR